MTRILLKLLKACGFFKLLFALNKDAVIIYMLHGVVDDALHNEENFSPLWRRTKSSELKYVLEALQPYVDFIDMDEVVDRLSGKTVGKKPAVVFTFDDGYSNNIDCAHPILNQFGAPMIVYFATGYTGKKLFWIDEIDYLLQSRPEKKFSITLKDTQVVFDQSSRESLQRDYQNFRKILRELCPDERELLVYVEDIKQQLDPSGTLLNDAVKNNIYFKILNEDEIINLPSDVTVGCHTVEHFRMDNIDRETIDQEISESKQYLEQITKKPCKHFCYPVGAFDDDAVNGVRAANFESAVTTRQYLNRPDCDIHLIDRLAFPVVPYKEHALLYLSKYFLRDMFRKLRSSNKNTGPAQN